MWPGGSPRRDNANACSHELWAHVCMMLALYDPPSNTFPSRPPSAAATGHRLSQGGRGRAPGMRSQCYTRGKPLQPSELYVPSYAGWGEKEPKCGLAATSVS